MKRIAVISDLHGNVPAMEAVLADLERHPVDEVLVGGDLVGRGPQGSEIVRRIRAMGWPAVRGNHEDYLLGYCRGAVPPEFRDQEEWAALRWMAARLDETDLEYIESMPMSVRSTVDPDLLLVHGSPRSNGEGLGPWTDDESLRAHLADIEGDLLICGHTHRPMCRRFPEGTVVNVGAVGLPFNRDRRAQYAVFARQEEHWGVEFRRVDYPLDRILDVYRSTGFLEHGRVTAQLLRLELEHATPFLVPFLRWARDHGRPAEGSQLEDYLSTRAADNKE